MYNTQLQRIFHSVSLVYGNFSLWFTFFCFYHEKCRYLSFLNVCSSRTEAMYVQLYSTLRNVLMKNHVILISIQITFHSPSPCFPANLPMSNLFYKRVQICWKFTCCLWLESFTIAPMEKPSQTIKSCCRNVFII